MSLINGIGNTNSVVRSNHANVGKMVSYNNYQGVNFKVPIRWSVKFTTPLLNKSQTELVCDYYFYSPKDLHSRKQNKYNGALMARLKTEFSVVEFNVEVIRQSLEANNFYDSIIKISKRFGLTPEALSEYILNGAPGIGLGKQKNIIH